LIKAFNSSYKCSKSTRPTRPSKGGKQIWSTRFQRNSKFSSRFLPQPLDAVNFSIPADSVAACMTAGPDCVRGLQTERAEAARERSMFRRGEKHTNQSPPVSQPQSPAASRSQSRILSFSPSPNLVPPLQSAPYCPIHCLLPNPPPPTASPVLARWLGRPEEARTPDPSGLKMVLPGRRKDEDLKRRRSGGDRLRRPGPVDERLHRRWR
jgi:hypothetical protein